jgi:kynurenine 3-monooxygenase
MDKRAIHLVDKLNFQNYGQEGESIYSISRGILNRKMIDLWKPLEQNSFEHKIWDNLDTCYFASGETERGAWEDRKDDMVLVPMELFQNRHRMQHQVCLIIRKNFTWI